jgi:hypothetical protein
MTECHIPKDLHLQNDRYTAKNRNAHLTMKNCIHIAQPNNIHVQRVNKFKGDKEINVSRLEIWFQQKNFTLIITKTEDIHSSCTCESLPRRLIIQCFHIFTLYFSDMSNQTNLTYTKSLTLTLHNYKNPTLQNINFITANMKVAYGQVTFLLLHIL